jgi:hypothetical protein
MGRALQKAAYQVKFTRDPAGRTTAATDTILALVAIAGILFIRWQASDNGDLWKLSIWSFALGSIGLAAALGFVAHGWVLSQTSHHRIWLTLNATLALAVSLFVVAVVYDLWGLTASLRTLPIMLTAGLGFYLATLLYPGVFFLFIVFESLSLFFAFAAYVFLAVRGDLNGAGLMAAGVMLSIIAAGFQAAKSIEVDVVWKFDHNGIYHIVQMVGLLFLFAGLRCSL